MIDIILGVGVGIVLGIFLGIGTAPIVRYCTVKYYTKRIKKLFKLMEKHNKGSVSVGHEWYPFAEKREQN